MSSEAIPFQKIRSRPVERSGHNPLDTPMAFQTPRLISDVSAWIQHIPFAFALIEMLKPCRLVELGTFKGDSYCAFCQAVDVLQLETECTAVDTWAGDAQSGVYDDEVFQALAGYHDPLYGRFSQLLRSSFDDAVDRFADGSIDLLHIDGLHNYAAVRHDFETWRPKLSDKAVVLMHDIDVREGDFGVYRLWEELRQHYPHFEFLHGYGLGVLLVGGKVPDRVQQFISSAEKSSETVRLCFQALGQRLELGRGVALLAKDVARQEARANEWKVMRKQPSRDPLPSDLGVGAFLEAGPCDMKQNIDRIHETSMNHLDDMHTITTDNNNLSSQMEELRALANLVGGLKEERLNDHRTIYTLRAEHHQIFSSIVLLRQEMLHLHQASMARHSIASLIRSILRKIRGFLTAQSG